MSSWTRGRKSAGAVATAIEVVWASLVVNGIKREQVIDVISVEAAEGFLNGLYL